ncbi:hypothetical protein OM306_24690 [Escherichia albertii]|uniref:Type 1 fimbrial protein n=1 Tax=Escherichia coli TaxID=562 RepID=A0A765T939_ECOLX|nr:hypothetical protein [Escherichia albertii]EGM7736534.1 type 1 fimbrial protein [Escherichia albertii]EHW5677733.1 type 1 fimbrial protein [Escherichia albertii]MCZ8940031.1 hypothetical protein [Escherichia albertii]MCZ8950091.1 hypothetical protein [Escherichia albertii]MCZ8955168.1 hypothetical protein [Escherichia albertii]
MKNRFLGSIISFGLFSAVNAASQEQKVINAPCDIAPESAVQSIDFGQLSKAHQDTSNISMKKNQNIKPVNCDATELANSYKMKVLFTGTIINSQVKVLGTAGVPILLLFLKPMAIWFPLMALLTLLPNCKQVIASCVTALE